MVDAADPFDEENVDIFILSANEDPRVLLARRLSKIGGDVPFIDDIPPGGVEDEECRPIRDTIDQTPRSQA